MDKNGWIVIGCLLGFALVGLIVSWLSKPSSGGGLIKPEEVKSETGAVAVPVSDEVKKRSVADVVLNPAPFPVFFERASAVANKVSLLFQDEDWFAGTCPTLDEKYGYIVEFRIFAEDFLQLKPNQFALFPDTTEFDGVRVCLKIMERGASVVNTGVNEVKADLVAEKLTDQFGSRPWVTYVGHMMNNEYPDAVLVGFDPAMLRLKPEDFEYFMHNRNIDGVKVYFAPLERFVALAKVDDE